MTTTPTGTGEAIPTLERVRHRKRGTEYEVLARGALIQTDAPLTDYAEVVVYRGGDFVWVRPVTEMDDGRFETIAPTTPTVTPDRGADEGLGTDLARLSAAATPGPYYVVDQPWGDGTWITAGSPDPHAGVAVAYCEHPFVDREAERAERSEAIQAADAAADTAFLAEAGNYVRAMLAARPTAPAPHGGETFQARVHAVFAAIYAGDPTGLAERVARHAEEAAELHQALGLTREDHHRIVDYVHDRPRGEPGQEMGGTLVTLAELATAAGLDMRACGEAELARVSTPEVVAKIRRKRAARYGRGVLPGDDADLVTTAPHGGQDEEQSPQSIDRITFTVERGQQGLWYLTGTIPGLLIAERSWEAACAALPAAIRALQSMVTSEAARPTPEER